MSATQQDGGTPVGSEGSRQVGGKAMFADAYEVASQFTLPAIVSVRHADRSVTCSIGAFVVLNPEGWMVTAGHMIQAELLSRQHTAEQAEHAKQVRAIETDPTLKPRQKQNRIERLSANPQWITRHAFWWGRDGVTVRGFDYDFDADLAIGRLEPFDASWVTTYPSIKNPANLRPGTALCKLGFPFYDIKATYDEGTGQFVYPEGTIPAPRFPIEGIFTREIVVSRRDDGMKHVKLLETSSPGLRGQSGGPVFDSKGTVWAIQSRTVNLPLGFSPKLKVNGKDVEEHQFLNVGVGVHPETLVQFLTEHGVKFNVSDY
jgi:hypothetical protein